MNTFAIRRHLFRKLPIRPIFLKAPLAKTRTLLGLAGPYTDAKSKFIRRAIRHLDDFAASMAYWIVGTKTTVQKLVFVYNMMFKVCWCRRGRLCNVCQGYFMSRTGVEFERSKALSSQMLVRPKKIEF